MAKGLYSPEAMKETIRKAIERKYGEIDDRGCYKNDRWFSLEAIIELINETIDDNDYMFIDE